MTKDLAYYMSLPYTLELRPSGEGWFARVKELPGCVSQGATEEEALAMIRDAMRGWLTVSLEDGDPIPEPRPDEEYSGQFRVRISRALHRKLVEKADEEGVSLNQYVGLALAEAIGATNGRSQEAEPDKPRRAPRLYVRRS